MTGTCLFEIWHVVEVGLFHFVCQKNLSDIKPYSTKSQHLSLTRTRICSTIVQSHWNYSPSAAKFCYDKAFDLVKDTICEVFAGPAKHGIHSASLQKTLYDTERLVLERIPQVTKFPFRRRYH